MYRFGTESIQKLSTADVRLRQLANDVLKEMDLTIVYGERNQETQDRLFDEGASKLRFPDSSHNHSPSLAIDVIPYPSQWKASKEEFTRMRELFNYYAGFRCYKLKPLIIFADGGCDFAHIELGV